MVTNFVNPLQKWADSSLTQKVPVESTRWALPPLLATIKGVKQNVFEFMLKLMIDGNPDQFNKGYIDLDQLYRTTTNPID